MYLLLFSAQNSALRRSSAPHLRLRGGDGEETQQPGQETLAQALAMAQARAAAPVRMSLDPARYRSASQGPPGSFPLPEYGEIDRVIDRATQTDGWAPVIPQYNGTLRWARHQWKGTINEHLWRPAAVSMIVPFLFIGATRFVAPSARWFPSPDETHPVRPPRSRFPTLRPAAPVLPMLLMLPPFHLRPTRSSRLAPHARRRRADFRDAALDLARLGPPARPDDVRCDLLRRPRPLVLAQLLQDRAAGATPGWRRSRPLARPVQGRRPAVESGRSR